MRASNTPNPQRTRRRHLREHALPVAPLAYPLSPDKGDMPKQTMGKSTTGCQLNPFGLPQTKPTSHPRPNRDHGAIEERS